MGDTVRLTSPRDGFVFGAWRSATRDARRGGLVLIQEIFGVTAHIRDLADGFAADGYETLAPSLFDRGQPGFAAEIVRHFKLAAPVIAALNTPIAESLKPRKSVMFGLPQGPKTAKTR